MEHLEYRIDLIGIDYVSCGPDTLYGDDIEYYRLEEDRFKTEGLGHYTRPEQKTAIDFETLPEYVKGMKNPTECLQNIARWMVKNGHSDQEIVKVIGGNALRLFKQVWY